MSKVYFAHGCSSASPRIYIAHGYSVLRTGLRGRALPRGARLRLPRLRLGYVFAHGCSRFAGLRGRALSRGGRSALPRLRLGICFRSRLFPLRGACAGAP
jgi:hypothetical protein